MQIDDPIDNPTEETMSDTTTSRYGYAPQAMFAATRAGAERRARETAPTATSGNARSGPAPRLLHRLATLLTGATS